MLGSERVGQFTVSKWAVLQYRNQRNQRNQMKKTMIIPALALLCSISAVAMAQKLKPD
jgi:hypothetical protein